MSASMPVLSNTDHDLTLFTGKRQSLNQSICTPIRAQDPQLKPTQQHHGSKNQAKPNSTCFEDFDKSYRQILNRKERSQGRAEVDSSLLDFA
jgi:tRNA U34 2-thiouridine synthase MnmA/TrmU